MRPLWLHRDHGPAFDVVEAFVSGRIWPTPRRFDGDTALASVDDSRLLGAIVFHNYDPENGVIEMSAAAATPRWFGRRIMAEMFGYPFRQLGCRVLTARTDAANQPLERMFCALGFSRHVLPHLRLEGDEAVYILTRDEWLAGKFNEVKDHGQEIPAAAHAAA